MKAIFHPQEWSGNQCCDAEAEGPVEFNIGTREEAVIWWREQNGSQAAKLRVSDEAIFQPDQYPSDCFQYHPNAPEWIREWDGPFYFDFEEGDAAPVFEVLHMGGNVEVTLVPLPSGQVVVIGPEDVSIYPDRASFDNPDFDFTKVPNVHLHPDPNFVTVTLHREQAAALVDYAAHGVDEKETEIDTCPTIYTAADREHFNGEKASCNEAISIIDNALKGTP